MKFVKRESDKERRAVTGLLAAALFCVFGLVAVGAMRPLLPQHISLEYYIPLHTVLEFASIVVSFAVFAVGWYGYRQTRNRQDLFIAVAFGLVGALDFVHTLTYRGMPNFLGTNTVGKAAAYWLALTYTAAISLLAASFVSPGSKSRWTRPGVLVPVAMAILAGVVAVFTVYEDTVSRLMYTDGSLTRFKVVLEYVVSAIFIAAFLAFYRARGWQRDSILLIQTALIFAIGSEICFTLYRSAYDMFNLLGHLYRVGMTYLVLQALFVSSLRWPYLELSRTKEQLQEAFASIGEALASDLRKEPTLALIVSLARQMFNADAAAIGETRDDGTIEVSSCEGLDLVRRKFPLLNSISGMAFAAGRTILVDDLALHPRAHPELLRLGIHAFMSAPIFGDGHPVGALYVASYERGKFSDEDAEILMAFARHASVAIANAEHYEREHRIAESLQQVIFPPDNLSVGQYSIAGKYQPAWDEAQVGGDFYDYFDLGDGRVGVAIGDVSGKGLDAAVHTAIVKYSFQAYTREGMQPAETLDRINEAFRNLTRQEHVPDHVFISQFGAVLDVETGRLTYSNAGHEPPVKLSKDGEVTLLDSTGPIIGLSIGANAEQAETTLDPGDVLVLYTDGITESRFEGHLFGHEGLVEALRDCNGSASEEIVERVFARAKEHGNNRLSDDVALVVIRRAK